LIIVLVSNTFSFSPLFSITLPPASAQISSLSSSTSPSPSPSPSPSSIGVKIDSPTSGQQVPINSILKISGSSTDTPSTDCKASVIVNNIKPYKAVVPAETNDFSSWNFLLNSSYTSIKEGPDNKITAKLECPPNLTKWYSVNVTGLSSTQASLNRSLPSPSSSPQSSQLISNFSNAEAPISIIRAGITNNPLFNASIINITSPVPGEQIPSGSKVTIWGTSMDDYYSNCKVYVKRNDLPFQNATAAGLTGTGDYSVWKFTYTDKYGLITPGNTNNLTAKISCNENSKNLSPASSNIRTNINTEDADGAVTFANIALVGVNQPPIVAIDVDNQEVKEGEEIVLDGKDSSDPNGDSLTYLWKQTGGFLDGFDILNPTKPVAHFKVPDDLTKDTTFDFELVVTDNYGGINTKTVSISAASNSAPAADAGGNIQAIRGEQVALDGSDSHDPDPTGEIISYLWRISGDNGDGDNGDGSGTFLQNRNEPVATFSIPFVQDDTTFEFRLIVTDDEGAEDEDSVKVEVKGNSKPVADAGSDKNAEIGERVTLDGGGSNDPDPTGEIVSYDWEQTGGSPSVGLNGASSATPSFTVPTIDEDTTFEFTLTVTDNEGATEKDEVQVEVEAPSPPPPPPSADADLSGDSEEDDRSNQLSASPLDENGGEEDEEAEEEDAEDEEDEDEEGDDTDLFSSDLRQIPDTGLLE
jgi:hypothetical protein